MVPMKASVKRHIYDFNRSMWDAMASVYQPRINAFTNECADALGTYDWRASQALIARAEKILKSTARPFFRDYLQGLVGFLNAHIAAQVLVDPSLESEAAAVAIAGPAWDQAQAAFAGYRARLRSRPLSAGEVPTEDYIMDLAEQAQQLQDMGDALMWSAPALEPAREVCRPYYEQAADVAVAVVDAWTVRLGACGEERFERSYALSRLADAQIGLAARCFVNAVTLFDERWIAPACVQAGRALQGYQMLLRDRAWVAALAPREIVRLEAAALAAAQMRVTLLGLRAADGGLDPEARGRFAAKRDAAQRQLDVDHRRHDERVAWLVAEGTISDLDAIEDRVWAQGSLIQGGSPRGEIASLGSGRWENCQRYAVAALVWANGYAIPISPKTIESGWRDRLDFVYKDAFDVTAMQLGTLPELTATLLAAGPGAKGILSIRPEGTGHVVAVENIGGKIYVLDGRCVTELDAETPSLEEWEDAKYGLFLTHPSADARTPAQDFNAACEVFEAITTGATPLPKLAITALQADQDRSADLGR